jgi:hypothetical protein
MAEMNAPLQQLSPAPLEKVGLVQALRDQCEALGYRTGALVAVEIGALPDDDRLPPGAQESLFRIAQEALSNIARHARAKTVTLSLGEQEGALRLEIRDDGQGFGPGAGPGSGMGLANIQERARALGGIAAISGSPGPGTSIIVQLPLAAPIARQEPFVYKTDHTFNKTFLVGLVGGLILIGVLWYPFHEVFPRWLLPEWLEGAPEIGLILQWVAVVLTLVIGGVAASWARAATRMESAALGAMAGGTAGLVAYFGVAVVVAGVAGARVLLRHTQDSLLVWEAQGLMLESFVDVLAFVYGGFWAALLAGAGLGVLGGIHPWLPSGKQPAERPFEVLRLRAQNNTVPSAQDAAQDRRGLRLTAMIILNVTALVNLLVLVASFVLYRRAEGPIAAAAAASDSASIVIFGLTPFLLALATPLAFYLLAMTGYTALLRLEGRIEPDDEVNTGRLLTASNMAFGTASVSGIAGLAFMGSLFASGGPGRGVWLALFASAFACLWQAASLAMVGREIRRRVVALGLGSELNRRRWLRRLALLAVLAATAVIGIAALGLGQGLPAWAIALLVAGVVIAALGAVLLLSRRSGDSVFRWTPPLFVPTMAGSLLGMILAIALPVMLVVSFIVANGNASRLLGTLETSTVPRIYSLSAGATYNQVQYYFILQLQVLLVTLVLAAGVVGIGILMTWAFLSLAARRAELNDGLNA